MRGLPRLGIVLPILALSVVLAACGTSAPSALRSPATTPAPVATTTTVPPTTTTTSLASFASQYQGAMTPVYQALSQWQTQFGAIENEAKATDILPTLDQISGVETPVINAMTQAVAALGQLSPPPSIQSDFSAVVGALSALEGDYKQIVALYPDDTSVASQEGADISTFNSTTAVLDAALHLP